MRSQCVATVGNRGTERGVRASLISFRLFYSLVFRGRENGAKWRKRLIALEGPHCATAMAVSWIGLSAHLSPPFLLRGPHVGEDIQSGDITPAVLAILIMGRKFQLATQPPPSQGSSLWGGKAEWLHNPPITLLGGKFKQAT